MKNGIYWRASTPDESNGNGQVVLADGTVAVAHTLVQVLDGFERTFGSDQEELVVDETKYVEAVIGMRTRT